MVHAEAAGPSISTPEGVSAAHQVPCQVVDRGLRKAHVLAQQRHEVSPHAVLQDEPQVVAGLVPAATRNARVTLRHFPVRERLLFVLCTPPEGCGTLMSPTEKPCWHTAGHPLSSRSVMEEAGASATVSSSCGQPGLRHHLLLALVPSHL